MTTFDEVTSSAGPWNHKLNRGDLTAIHDAAVAADVLFVELDGSRMRILDDLFDEYAQAFSFPQPWGENWPAFAEFMRSLKWLPARRCLVIVSNGSEILAADQDEIATYLRLLELQGKHWANSLGLGYERGHGEVPFHTVLVMDE